MPDTKRGSEAAGKPAGAGSARPKPVGVRSARPKPAGARSARPKKTAAVSGKLSVKQVRSGIGHAATFRRTLEALGIRHHQQTVVVSDNPSIRGMLFKVRHLVQVSPVEEA